MTNFYNDEFYNLKTDNGSAFLVDAKKTRITNLRKTLYNFGVGVEENYKGYKAYFVTLTYNKNNIWEAQDVKLFINNIRNYFKRNFSTEVPYCWCAELQKRGVIHYHLIFYIKKGLSLPSVRKKGWWKKGFVNQKIAKKGIGYLLKYISKTNTKNNFPEKARIYGYGGVIDLVKQRIRFYRSNSQIRQEIIDMGLTYRDVDIRRDVGFKYCKKTGLYFENKYGVYWANGKMLIYTLNKDNDFDSDFIKDMYLFTLQLKELEKIQKLS